MKLFGALLFCGIVLSASGQPVQWPVSAGGNGHSYEGILAPNGITWGNAQNNATVRGGYLATITSAAENQFVYNLIAGNSSFWYVTGTEGCGPLLGGLP